MCSFLHFVYCVCVIYLYIVFFFATIILSIYTLSDLGDLSNLIAVSYTHLTLPTNREV